MRVVERLAGDLVRLEIDGKTFNARANATLTPGDTIRVHVKGIDESGRIVLELVREGESPLLRSMDLPQDESHRAALEAFVRSGLPLDPTAIAGTARRARSEGPDAAYIARLIAVLRGKGLPAHLVDEISSATGGETRDDSDNRRDDEHRSNPGFRQASTDRIRRLADAIRSIIETPATTSRAIHLMNHFREGLAHWALIPLSVEPFDSVTVAVRFGESGVVDRATVRIADGETRYQASWAPSGGRVALSANDPEAVRTAKELLAPLAEALERLGLEPMEPRLVSRLDGFSDEPVEHILRSVDTEV